jgi:hypothetical protein
MGDIQLARHRGHIPQNPLFQTSEALEEALEEDLEEAGLG